MRRWAHILVAASCFVAPGSILAASPPGAASCLGCHSAAADDNPVPQLGKFTAEQIVTSMQAFRSGTRPSTVMERIAKGFSDEEIEAIARWYASSQAE